MSVLDLFRRRSLPGIVASGDPLVSPWAEDNHLDRLVLSDLYQLDAEALPITRDVAMRVPSVRKGVNIIKTTVARCPVVTLGPDGKPMETSMTTQLSAQRANSTVIAGILDSLIFYGRAYVLLPDFYSTGWPSHLEYIPEGWVTAEDGQLTHINGEPVGSRQWFRIDALTEGLMRNGGQPLRDIIDVRQASAEAGANPVPQVILSAEDPNVSQQEMDELQTRWVAGRRKKYGSAAVVNPGVKATPFASGNGDLLLGSLNVANIDAARLLSLPAWAIDAAVEGTSLSYSNSASRMRELVEFGLRPYLTALEDALSLLTPRGQTVQVDVSELVNSDRRSRWEDYEIGIRAGFIRPEEVRTWEGLDPLPADPSPPAPDPAADDQDPDPTEDDSR